MAISNFYNYQEFLNEMAISDKDIETTSTFLNDISKVKQNIQKLKDTVKELRERLSSIDEFTIRKKSKNGNSTEYLIDFNGKTAQLLRLLSLAFNDEIPEKVKPLYKKIIFPDAEDYVPFYTIDIQISDILNRIHISEGIPHIFQGIGLGKKIYKKCIEKFGYISTNRFNRSIDAVSVWDSLRKDQDIFSFVKNEEMICFNDKLPFEKIESVILKFMSDEIKEKKNGEDPKNYILDSDFKTKFRTEILNSEIKYLL